jgi:hypothetical protein
MPNNECIPFYEEADRLAVQVAAGQTVVGKRFISAAANRLSGPLIPATAQIGASDPTDGGRIQVAHTAAGATPLGVSSWDAATGEGVDAIRVGVVPITAAANIAAGAAVEVGANGQVQTWGGTIATAKVGTCVDGALSGADAQIALLIG